MGITNRELIKKEYNGVTFVNCTPHEINIVTSEPGKEIKELVSFKPSGAVARVITTQNVVNKIAGIEVMNTEYRDVNLGVMGMPEGTVLIVSALVLSALKAKNAPELKFCVAPDTNNAIRNGMGHIVGVPGFTV